MCPVMPVWSPTLLTPMTSPTSSSLQARQVRTCPRLSCLQAGSRHENNVARSGAEELLARCSSSCNIEWHQALQELEHFA